MLRALRCARQCDASDWEAYFNPRHRRHCRTVDPIEDAGRPATPRACEPPADAAKHRGCVGVGHKQAGELALVVALDELDASRIRDDAQLVEATVVVLPRHGPEVPRCLTPEDGY